MEVMEARLLGRKRKLEVEGEESRALIKIHTARLSQIEKCLDDINGSLNPRSLFQLTVLEEVAEFIAVRDLLRLVEQYATEGPDQRFDWKQGSEELTARLRTKDDPFPWLCWAYLHPPLGVLPFRWSLQFRRLPPCYDDRDQSHDYTLRVCLVDEKEVSEAFLEKTRYYGCDPGPPFPSCLELLKCRSHTKDDVVLDFDVNPYSAVPTLCLSGHLDHCRAILAKCWSVPNLLQYRLVVMKGSESAIDIVIPPKC